VFFRTPRARFLSLWAPVAVYMAMIFFISALPSAPLPEEVSDKTGHLAAYVVLGVLSVRAVGGGLPCRVTVPIACLALAIASGYGAFDEGHQWFVPGRSAETSDLVADAIGAVAGAAACWAWGIIAPASRDEL